MCVCVCVCACVSPCADDVERLTCQGHWQRHWPHPYPRTRNTFLGVEELQWLDWPVQSTHHRYPGNKHSSPEGGGVVNRQTSTNFMIQQTANSKGKWSKFLMLSGNRKSAFLCLVMSTLCSLPDVYVVCVCVCVCARACVYIMRHTNRSI